MQNNTKCSPWSFCRSDGAPYTNIFPICVSDLTPGTLSIILDAIKIGFIAILSFSLLKTWKPRSESDFKTVGEKAAWYDISSEIGRGRVFSGAFKIVTYSFIKSTNALRTLGMLFFPLLLLVLIEVFFNLTKSSIVSVPRYGYSTKNENLTGLNMKIFYYLSDGYTSQSNYFEESSKIASGQIVEGKGYDVKQRRMLFGKRMDGSKYVVPSVSYKLNCTELPYCVSFYDDTMIYFKTNRGY